MSPTLRVEMIVLAAAMIAVVFRAIRRGKLLVRFSLLWLAVSVGMLIVAAFPGIVIRLSRLVQIETPSNLVYLLGILLLLLIVLRQTELLSRHTEQIKRLTQELSLERMRAQEGKEDNSDAS